jgi:purine-binding chemotaxis protein CheW
MSTMMLVVVIAGGRAGIPAPAVNSVIDLASITPVPRAAPHVAGLAALRSRPLTVIDCRAALGLEPDGGPSARRRAVVVEHEGHLSGLLVDAADAIVASRAEPDPIGADPGPGWREVASGRIETEAGALLVLDLAALIAGPDRRAAA